MTLKAHATLGASSSERWMNCPGSIRLSVGMPNNTSEYAAEGTAAHGLAERCLLDGSDPYDHHGEEVKVDGFEFTIDDVMCEATTVYVDFIREQIKGATEYEIECRLDLSELYPNMFGTGDCLVYIQDTETLIVNDYKHGQGVAVDPEENPQLLYYGVGAAIRFHNRGVRRVILNVIQPRCGGDPIRSWELSYVDLIDFQRDLVAAAKLTEEPDAPLVAGDWCKFCPAAAVCPALYDQALKAALADFTNDGELILPDVYSLSPQQLGERLELVHLLESWVKRIREYAHNEAVNGRVPPGFKLVDKRPVRRWADEHAVVDMLQEQEQLSDEQLYITKLKSPAQIERILGKRGKAVTAPFITAESSGTSLVHESDKREKTRSAAEDDFADEKGGIW